MNTATHTPMTLRELANRDLGEWSLGDMPSAALDVRYMRADAHYDLVRALTVAREDLGDLVQCRHSSDTCNCNEHCRLRDIDAALEKAGAA